MGYLDSDFAGDLDKRKSISGYMFMLNICIISWKVSLDPVIDRVRRPTRAPNRFGYADLIALTLVSANEIAFEEPGSYSKAIKRKDCDKRLVAIQEEMNSL